MKKIVIPAFIAVFSIFVAQIAFKVTSMVRCSPELLPGDFQGLPLSMLANSAADTIGIAGSMAAFVSFATFMFNYVSHAEAKNKEANKS